MRLSAEQCWARVQAADHGVLCTRPDRGVDAVPICFVVVRAERPSVVATPVDLVKPKDTTELARVRNLEREPRATLLCEHWDRDDWTQLWWVTAHLVHRSEDRLDALLLDACEGALRHKYPQYREAEFARLLVLDVEQLSGWAAAEPGLPPER